MFMHVSAKSTLDWYCICMCVLTLVSTRGEFETTLADKVQVSTAKKKKKKRKVVPKFQYATNYYAWQNVIYLYVLFLNGAWCLWGMNCGRITKKTKMRVKGTAQASERTLKCVVPVAIQGTVIGLSRNGKAGVLWYLTVLRPFFFKKKKLFSLRGGGHYLPSGFRFSAFLLSFQSLVLVMGFTFCTSRLWWFLRRPFWESENTTFHQDSLDFIDITVFSFSECLLFLYSPSYDPF